MPSQESTVSLLCSKDSLIPVPEGLGFPNDLAGHAPSMQCSACRSVQVSFHLLMKYVSNLLNCFRAFFCQSFPETHVASLSAEARLLHTCAAH